jgi:hypothetical protein
LGRRDFDPPNKYVVFGEKSHTFIAGRTERARRCRRGYAPNAVQSAGSPMGIKLI